MNLSHCLAQAFSNDLMAGVCINLTEESQKARRVAVMRYVRACACNHVYDAFAIRPSRQVDDKRLEEYIPATQPSREFEAWHHVVISHFSGV